VLGTKLRKMLEAACQRSTQLKAGQGRDLYVENGMLTPVRAWERMI